MKVKVLTIRLKWVEYDVSPVKFLEKWVVKQILDSKFGVFGWIYFKEIKQ